MRLNDKQKQQLFDKFSAVDSRGHTLMTPCVVSKTRKTLYLHIAKTGGSSITRCLMDLGMDDYVLTNKKKSSDDKKRYFYDIVNEWDSYYTFTFIRNKYDQLVSLYHYDRHLLGNISFEDFIEKRVATSKDEYGFWIDQYYLTHTNGLQVFDFIGKTETHDDDWRSVCERVAIPYTRKEVNVGKYDKNRTIASFYNETTLGIVNEKFREEIDHFGWELKNG